MSRYFLDKDNKELHNITSLGDYTSWFVDIIIKYRVEEGEHDDRVGKIGWRLLFRC